MAAAFAAGQSHRLLWIDGAAIRIESWRDADARGKEGQQIYFERREDVDYERVDRGCGRGVGQSRGRQSPRLSCWKRDAGIQGVGRARKVVVARLGDIRIGSDRLRNPGRKSFARRCGVEGAAELFESGAVWNWMGRAGSGDGVLRHGAAVRENAQAICEQTHCFSPVGAGKISVDDYGNREGTIAGAARWTVEGQWKSSSVAYLDAKNEQRGYRTGYRPQGARHSRRERDRRRLLHHAAHEQPRKRIYLRGDQRHSQAGDRRAHHRHCRVRVKMPRVDQGPPLYPLANLVPGTPNLYPIGRGRLLA